MRIEADDVDKRFGERRETWSIAHCGKCGAEAKFTGDFITRERAARSAGWKLYVGDANEEFCPRCTINPDNAVGDLFAGMN